MKKTLWIILVIALIGLGIYYSMPHNTSVVVTKTSKTTNNTTYNNNSPITRGVSISSFDPKNATYNIDDTSVTLVNGKSDVEATPGSATTITTQYFGNEATGDLNGDDVPDDAFIIVQYGAGTGIFYYVEVALSSPQGYKVTNSIVLGDRVAPQSAQIRNLELIINYTDRKDGEPMTASPTVGITKYFKVTSDGTLIASE